MSEARTWLMVILSTVFMIAGVIGISIFLDIKTAGVESELYNEKYGTHYTTKDFFFAGHTIKRYLNKDPQSTVNLDADLRVSK